jgi:nucleotide-binding universal stress UspA family protein
MVLPNTAQLTVLTVAPHSLISHARPDPRFLSKATPAARHAALQEAAQLARREALALDPTVPVDPVSAWGHPVEAVLRAANRTKADLIVMGAKGHSDLRITLLGSVSQGIAHATPRPLLVARPGTKAVRKVVLGYYGGATGKKALGLMDRLHLPEQAELVIVTAVEPLEMPAGTATGRRRKALSESGEMEARLREDAGKTLDALAAELKAEGQRVTTEVVSGKAPSAIDEVARNHRADLIVVGSRRPAATGDYAQGSTAEKLVRHAHTSVLVVR